MKLLSLNAGTPRPLVHGDGVVQSAIVKRPLAGTHRLGPRGLEADEQADKVHHGHPDQAICVYPSEHYPYWRERLGRPLPEAAFGENFTTEGLTEADVCMGDRYRVGERGAVVEVSGPRVPCSKLGARNGEPHLPVWVRETGFSGFYLSVVTPGEVEAGDAIDLVGRHERGVALAELNRLVYVDVTDAAATRRALAADGVTPYWRERLERNLR